MWVGRSIQYGLCRSSSDYTECMKGYKLREITRQAKYGSQWFAGAGDRRKEEKLSRRGALRAARRSLRFYTKGVQVVACVGSCIMKHFNMIRDS